MVIQQVHVDRFICKVDMSAAGGCWLWTGAVRRWSREPWDGGYGAFWHQGKVVRAHVFCFWWLFGAVPDGKVLLHHCDNRRCVNVVDHVRPGTQQENIRDMVTKRRARNRHMVAIR